MTNNTDDKPLNPRVAAVLILSLAATAWIAMLWLVVAISAILVSVI